MTESAATTASNDSALVSVIMATYAGDSPKLFEQAVGSVQAQTHDHFEFLIVLDGPVGRETQSFLDRLTLHDDRIQVLPRPENEGAATARNHGIDRAVGDYIAILDADDLAIPERLERQLAFLEEKQADLVGSFYRLIDESGAIIGKREVPMTPQGIRNSFCVFNPIANSTVLARASVLKKTPYPQRYQFARSYAAGHNHNQQTGIGRLNPLRLLFASADKCIEFEDCELWIQLLRQKRLLLNQDEYLVLFRNDERFLARRTGLRYFGREFRCKLTSVPLYPIVLAPAVIVIMLASSLPRLLPVRLLRTLYVIRGFMRFGN